MACTITGTLYDPSGIPVANTTIFVTQRAIVGVTGGASLPIIVTTQSDGQGAVSFDMLPGAYELNWRDIAGQHFSAPLSVPDEASASLEDLLVAMPTPVRGPKGDTGDVTPEAEAARDKAQDWAEGSGEPGGPGTKSAKTWAGEAEDYALASGPFADRAAAQSATIPGDVDLIRVRSGDLLLEYLRDPSGTALQTADGAKWSPELPPRPEHFGAVGDGVADDTAAVQAWVNHLVGAVRVGAARSAVFRLTATVEIQGRIVVQGMVPQALKSIFTGADAPNARGGGTWFHLDHTGIGFRIMAPSDAVADERFGFLLDGFGTLRTHNADTGTGWTPTVHDFDIVCHANAKSFPAGTIRNWVPLNPYKAFQATRAPGATSGSVGRIFLENVFGQPFHTGTDIDCALDSCTLDNVRFWPFWSDDAAVIDWQQANGSTFLWGRADRCNMINCFAWGYHTGLETYTTVHTAGGGARIWMVNCGWDSNTGHGYLLNADDGYIRCNTQSHFGKIEAGNPNTFCTINGDNNQFWFDTGRARNTRSSLIDVNGSGNKIGLGAVDLWNWDFANTGAVAIDVADGNTVSRMLQPNFEQINSPGSGKKFSATGTWLCDQVTERARGRFIGTTDADGRVTISHGLSGTPEYVTVTLDYAGGSIGRDAALYSRGASSFVVQVLTSTNTAVTSGQSAVIQWSAAKV